MTEISWGRQLIAWYMKNKRALPWRDTSDPYLIWLSEVIMQQTRVSQGLEYFRSFAERFPDVESLALAKEEDVLKLWQGLGYYSRARNLHRAAQRIMEHHKGVFPGNYSDLLSLNGVGPYTAAAIASIAFHLPYPVLDGNVYRVLSRFLEFDDPVNSVSGKKKAMKYLIGQILTDEPGTFNEALMELGALVCLPRNPKCNLCPFHLHCLACKHDTVNKYPIPQKKAGRRIRYFYYLVINQEDNESTRLTYLQQRGDGDIWSGLYEFPLIETLRETGLEELLLKGEIEKLPGGKPKPEMTIHGPYRHILTHQTLIVCFISVKTQGIYLRPKKNWIAIHWEDLPQYPVSRLTERFIESTGLPKVKK